MSLLAIIVDVITALTYFFQAKLGTVPVYLIGIVVQAVATLVLIIWTFTYQHQRYRNPLIFGFFTATFSYGIIVISAAVNALILVLYVMNITGINHVIFS